VPGLPHGADADHRVTPDVPLTLVLLVLISSPPCRVVTTRRMRTEPS
jgi:hypothetical protein